MASYRERISSFANKILQLYLLSLTEDKSLLISSFAVVSSKSFVSREIEMSNRVLYVDIKSDRAFEIVDFVSCELFGKGYVLSGKAISTTSHFKSF